MVRGITFPDGDPYLQRQNEPSIAVSTRNPCHLLAGANDYRSVDIPFDDTQPPNSESNVSLAADAWLGLFKSVDCGAKWTSTLLPGYPQDNSGQAMELKGYAAGADPTVRAGTNGIFYYSGMVFNRDVEAASKIFVARFVDNNNKERGDPFEFLDVATIDIGTKGQFLDKPWLAPDVPRNGFGPGSTLATGNTSSSGSCVVNGQQVAAGNVYMAWARFTGDKHDHSKLMFARSQDCGRTWQSSPISNNQQISQGANIAIAPHDGTIYLTWREFARTTGGTNTPVSFWFAMSSDGGKTFTSPRKIADNVATFDQLRSNTTFRSNALPAIVADHQDRVYIAWSARGSTTTCTTPSGTVRTNTDEARIMMMVSGDRGRTFGPLFPIDPGATCGHQMMPSLAFSAGKIQAIWYDAREDASRVFGRYVDDRDVTLLRHTVDVRGAQAEPATIPVFTSAGNPSLELSRYREWQVGPPDNRQSVEVGSNPPNLPMYAQGTTPFMGDYIDVSALAAFPIQSNGGQVWQPNIGTVNMMGPGTNNISTPGFPTLPIFHAAWTDNRDVRIAAQCLADPSTGAVVQQQFGQRNANIYTSRLTPGFFVGSPGNTKPLGFRKDPETGQQTTELIQRGFVVFAQNTTDTLRFFQFSIANQPAGGRASFRQFDPAGAAPQIVSTVAIPRRSTVARTVYATSTDLSAQILVNVQEVSPVPDPGVPPSPGDPGSPGGTQWTPIASGLRSSILLNPDRTNPPIEDPDELDPDVPEIASTEVHNPSMFDAQFFRYPRGTVSSRLDVRNPDPENPDPENPDPENPDPENPDPENPDPENPDPENPDPENPDPENPDPENPDPENPDVENTAISAAELANAAITDVNWRVHNNGNTTSAYRFRPSLPREFQNQKYQLIVTRRYMVLTMDPVTCQPIYKSYNQVLVNIQNFRPKTPDPENPDPENPDPENPDPENPDPENPDPENPDPENPDPENANFFLAPEETATVTLRVFDLDPDDSEPAPTTENDVAGKTAAQAANTGETEVSTAVAGPDLALDDVPPTISPAVIRPGATVNVTWTLTNRGTASAIVPPPHTAIRTNVYFSADDELDPGDLQIGPVILEPTPFVHCTPSTPIEACSTATTTVLNLAALPPQFQAPGQYFLIVVTDDDNDADDPAGEVADPDRLVFEADELNNVLVVPITVDAYQLMFVQQPSTTTQDFAMAPVTVAVTHPDGGLAPPSAVPFVTLSIQTNPAVPPGVLSGTVARPNVNGVATFGDLRIDRAAAGYTLAASAPISTGAISAPFNITVDLPPVVGPDSFTADEDTALTVAASGLLSNDSDPPTTGTAPPGRALTTVVDTAPLSGQLNLALDGSFSYTPNAGFNGIDTFTYRARDGRAGNETAGTATITVVSINDAPGFTAGADVTVLEDAGAYSASWATNITAGPANEAGQAVNFIVTNDNLALFTVQPALSPTGTLTFTPAPGASGAAAVTVRLHDNGGTANGGIDTSAPQVFTIAVTSVSDAPVAVGDAYSTNEDTPFASGALSVLNNDTDEDPGTTLTAVLVSTTTNGTLTLSPNGTFSYAPNANFFGTDSFTYRASDGGATLSSVATVTITVNAVNDVPSFARGANQAAPTGSLAQVVTGWATGISTGPANESTQTVSFIVTNDNAALFDVQPAVAANGALSYTPRQNREGTANVTVSIQDSGGTANGGVDTSAPQTLTITVSSTIQNYVVTNTNDSGNGSLRAAILNANLNASPDFIQFNLSGTARTINLLSPLPAITFPVTINGSSQPGYAGTPIVEIHGGAAGAANGFTVTASNVTIRGLSIVGFAGNGIMLQGGTQSIVESNRIGLRAGTAGTVLGNGNSGVYVANSSGNTVAHNVIGGNALAGVFLFGDADVNQIHHNLVGTNPAGTAAAGNLRGIVLEGSAVATSTRPTGNVIDANQIAGNTNVAIDMSCNLFCGADNTQITGNTIGLSTSGAVLANGTGIQVLNGNGTLVSGNVIAGGAAGIVVSEGAGVVAGSPIVIRTNRIGTDSTGSQARPNGVGIRANGVTIPVVIGGTTAEGNLIAFNTGAGVNVLGTAVSIRGNAIHGNTGLGIDLSGDGVTPNDEGDGDSGPNQLQNYPVLTLAHGGGGAVALTGSLNSQPNTIFTIEFFSNAAADATGFGEGQQAIGTMSVTTDAGGNVSIATVLPAVAAGSFITATATSAAGLTSEFSQARAVSANLSPTANNDLATTNEDAAVSIPVRANDTDPDGDPLTIVNLVAPANGTATIAGDGTITYTPAANYFGSDAFTYQASDGRGGLSLPATVSVTINAVNDVPSFTPGASQTVNMNSGAQSVPTWATNISAGAANESGQGLTFVVTNDNPVLFTAQPAVSPVGTLTYQPAPGVAGDAIVSVSLHDDGIPPLASAISTFTISIAATGSANFVVTNINDSGNGSLRKAVEQANQTAQADTITFAIDGPGPHVIQPLLGLPILTSPVTIDATTQAGYDGRPMVELDGTNSIGIGFGTSTDVSGVTIRGFAITRFQNAAIYMLQHENQAGNVVAQNFIGTDRDYTPGRGNAAGIALRADNSTINNNVIGNNSGPGIRLENDADSVTIAGNSIGISADGLVLMPNTAGIRMFGSLNNNVIDNNLISGNSNWGIDIQDSGPDVTSTLIRSNTIGLRVDGTAAPNGSGGISLQSAGGTTAGGIGFRNVISGNGGPGIFVTGSPAVMPLVQGNYIGTDATGTLARPNTHGIEVVGNSSAQIGGTQAGQGNVISGNADSGIRVAGPGAPTTAAVIIQGNIIGLDATGVDALGNVQAGIATAQAAIDVGGVVAAARNIISSNPIGINLSNSGSTYHTFIRGNYIGTDITGLEARGNSTGVLVGSAPGTRVGGNAAGAGNLIAGNSLGVSLSAISQAVINVDGVLYNSLVQGNTFGLAAGGAPLPNGYGVALGNSDNLVGGSTPSHSNIIAHSTNDAVSVAPGMLRNRILRNSIYGSGNLGIDLGNDGVTANDALDADAGANTLQNFPVLTAASGDGTGTAVSGSLDSTPNATFTVEVFSNATASVSGHGEGRTFLGALNVTTDALGHGTFSATFGGVGAGSTLAATVTDASGNTSEFSLARAIAPNTAPTTTNDSLTAYTGDEAVLYAAANDTDPDVLAPEVLTTIPTLPPGSPLLPFPSELAIVDATGLAYFSGAGTTAVPGRFGILNTNTATVTGTLSTPAPGGVSLPRVNQTTQIAYMRSGNNLVAIDGRSGSPTFNQVILSMSMGTINAMAIDETRGRLYLTTVTTTPQALLHSRVVALDVNPASATFHQVANELPVPSTATAFPSAGSIGVNHLTNRIYVTVNTGALAGVVMIDGSTFAPAVVANTAGASTLAVNATNNTVYAIQGLNLYTIDGATNTRIGGLVMPANAVSGSIDTRLALHRGTGRVFVRLGEFPSAGSRLLVVDGDRNSPTFNTILATIPLGRDGNQTMVGVDEAANRLITLSRSDLDATIIDTTTNAVVGTVTATQPMTRLTIDPTHHRAYLAGAIGYIQSIDLVAGTLHALIPTGAESTSLVVDTVNHSAHVTETGVTTSVKRFNETGALGTAPLPHGDGRTLALARNSVTNRIYALNINADADGGDDALPGFVSVIDGNTNTVLANVPVSAMPFQGIAVNETTNKIYVGGSGTGGVAINGTVPFPGAITVIDGVTHATAQADLSQIPQTSAVPGLVTFARDFVVNPTTGKVYVRITGGSTATMGVLDGTTNVVTPLPNIFGNISIHRVNPVLNRVYIAGTDADGEPRLFVLDGDTDELLATMEAASPSGFSAIQSNLAINRTTGRLYMVDFADGQFGVFDGLTNTLMSVIPVGRGPTSVAVNETQNRIYVANTYDRTLMIVDGTTNRVVRTIPLPLMPDKVDVDEAAGRIFLLAAANEPGVMVVSDPGTNAPVVTSVTQGAHGTVTLNADGSITYQAAAGYTGPDSYTYTVTDGQGGSATATVNVNVVAALDITTGSLPPATVGSSYAQTIVTTGGTGARTLAVSSGSLPGGIVLDASTGLLSGTARQSGNFDFTIQARDSGNPEQVTSDSFSIVVGPPVILNIGLPTAFVNTPYSQTLFVGGATGAVTWSIDRLNNPLLAWLSLSADGVLSGTPPEAIGTLQFNVTATDSLNQSATRSLSVFVNGPLTMLPLREGIVLEGQPMNLLGGNGNRSVTLTSGSLPPGLTLVSTGSFSGSPTRHGSYNFTLQLRDCEPNANGTPSCTNQVTQQIVNRNVTLRVSAKDQQGSSQTQNAILFGGATGPRLAQVVTVGAHGTLTGIGLQNMTCPSGSPVSVDIQRLTLSGMPDDNTIATGTAFINYNAITTTPEIPVAIGERFAFIVRSPVQCSYANAAVTDQYQGGDAYASFGGGAWQTLFSTFGRYDLPLFRTLIQPARDVIYTRGHGSHTNTLLNDGRVLIVGGNTLAEIYDPATNLAVPSAGNPAANRAGHTATLLADGRVLVAGGRVNGVSQASAEIFDPATGQFSTVSAPMSIARDGHQAVRLNDGSVLLIGGIYERTPLATQRTATAEIFDPATQTFTPTGSMSLAREVFTAVLLQSGKVLVAGGYTQGSGSSAETYDPATGVFTPTTGAMVVGFRGWLTGTLLADGRVLIVGGQSGDIRNEAELYNPATNTFTATGSMARPRYVHTAALLPDGSVLVAGGYAETSSQYIQPLATMERYIPESGTFVTAGSMETVRQTFAATTLANGRVLLSGGGSLSWMTGNTAELYDPATSLSISPTLLADAPLNIVYPPVTFNGAGGSSPYQISIVSGMVPPGMMYTQATRTLSGTPTATGIFPLGFRVVDEAANSVVQTVTLRVGAVATITSPYRLVDGAIGVSYSLPLTASGTAPFTWSLAPNNANLPPGLSLSPGGEISGMPTTAAYFNFTVLARDNTGQTATKVLSINVRQPMTITTTSPLGHLVLFGGGPCINTSDSNGTRTFSIIAGAAPAGLTLSGSNNCFTGTVRQTGAFTFTVQVTDQSSPPQTATREFTVNSWALDQDTGFNSNQPALTFGTGTGRRLGQRVITGITGLLRGVRLNGLTCPAGTVFTASLQGMSPDGSPDGVTVVSGTGIAPDNRMVFTTGQFMAADAEFALLFDADQSCSVRPNNFDGYPGVGFVSEGGGDWVALPVSSSNVQFDVPFTTLVEPVAGLIPMNNSRGLHTQTLLGNGLVLIAGGSGSSTTAELLNPATGTSTAIVSPMTTTRAGHRATLLADGRVLLTGGYNSNFVYQSSTEIFDPASNTFTAAGSMASARYKHTATLLANGQVLVAGGYNGTTNVASAELFNPATGTFQSLPNMISSRNEHTATRLVDGRVLLASGYSAGTNSEVYDPGTQTFTATGQTVVSRGRHTATLLNDGRVLITGGTGNWGTAESSAEIFDPAAASGVGAFQSVVPGMQSPRFDHAAALLADGSVLISGGLTDNNCCYLKPPTASMELYIPALNQFAGAGSSLVSRYVHDALSLGASRVLLSGTFGWSSAGGRVAEVVDVAARPRFTSTNVGRGSVGQPYSLTLSPQGGAGSPYVAVIVSGRLPGGVTFDSASMTFSGTPTEAGTFPVTVRLSDSAGTSVLQALTFRVDTLLITTSQTLPTAVQGIPYVGVGLSAQGIGSVTWTIISGALPAGLTLNPADGSITGTPTVSCCSTSFVARATDASGQTATAIFVIPVQAPLVITTTGLPIWTTSETPFGCVAVNGGSGNRTFSLSGTYPIGLSILNNGCFDSTYPARALRQGGTFTFTVHVSDQSVPVQSDTQEFTIRVHAQEQSSGWQDGVSDVPVPDSRRLAQVFTSSSVFPLSGVHVFDNLQCEAGVVVTAQAWRVTGAPARPNEAMLLATGQTTASPTGYVGLIIFPTPVDMPRGAQFAITLDTAGTCSMRRWPTTPFYKTGDAFVDDGSGWSLARAAVGREDLPITTMVLPPLGQRFFSGWRGGASVVTMADGRVLIAGPDQYAEIYDPVNNTLTQTGNMGTARHSATATLLADGRVLVAGGQVWNGPVSTALNTTEIFNPAAGTFSGGPAMGDARFEHTATTLPDGRVLITGGRLNGNSLNSAVLFDVSAANAVNLIMTGARAHHTATVLADDRVFILGGWTSTPFPPQQGEIFDPANNSFTPVSASMPYWPFDHTATLLTTGDNAGRLLIAGSGPYPQLSANAYFFDPLTPAFTAGPNLRLPRIDHSATELSDGRVVFAGGAADWSNWIATPIMEIYNPVSNQFTLASDLVTDMLTHTSVRTTAAGQDLVVSAGGWGSGSLAGRTGDASDPASANGALAITTITLPDGLVGQEYNGTGLVFLNAVNCQPVCDWTLAWGNLPPGLFLGINGELVSNGGLTAAGAYSFVLRVTDASRTATRAFTITVNRLTVTTTGLPNAAAGVPYSQQLTASGGTGGYTWTVTSGMPPGLSLSASGLISGTVATAGTWFPNVTVTDASGQAASKSLTLQVLPP